MQLPIVGHVIRFAYLWKREANRGQMEGLKDRPCAVVIATSEEAGAAIFYVAPITHAEPDGEALAVELPAATKARLGLDAERSWVITTETNRFAWPGPDVRPNQRGEAIVGLLPGSMTERIIANIRRHALAGRFGRVERSED